METARVGQLVLICALGAITACNGEEVLHPDAGGDGPGIPDGGSSTAVAGSAGGTFTFHGGKVTLEVPPGALSKDTTIQVLVLASYPKDSRLVPGTVYDLLPDGTTFNKTVKLSITYDQASVPPGMAEADLRIHKVVSGSWKLISGGGANANANMAWAGIKGFSKYGVKGPKPAAVDGMADTSVDAAVPVDTALPDMPVDAPKSDLSKSDAPIPDAPKPDLPQPDLPLPDMPVPPDAPLPPDLPLPDQSQPDVGQPDMSKPDMKLQCSGQPSGAPCDDGNPCTKGDACDGKGACTGTPYSCTPSSCQTSTCDGKGGCQTKLLANNCLISGSCFKASAQHPGGCATCVPLTSTTSWTITGTTHCLISNVCRVSGHKDLGGCAACDPFKSKTAYSLLPGKCRIDGACHSSGAKHPGGCGSCDPAKSTTTWTPSGNNCVIDHACHASGAKHAAGCGTCDPSQSQTDWTVSGSQCLIGSTCRSSGAKEPGGCGVCDPTKSKTSWSRSSGCMVAHAWAKKVDGGLYGMAMDSNGNIYITGAFDTSINLGGSTLSSKDADVDVFLASFTPSGKHRWSKAFGGKGADEGHDVAVDGSGNVHIIGTFAANINFGGGGSGTRAARVTSSWPASPPTASTAGPRAFVVLKKWTNEPAFPPTALATRTSLALTRSRSTSAAAIPASI